MQIQHTKPCTLKGKIPNRSHFCESCKEHVVDLRTLSDQELQAFLSNIQTDEFCGIATNDQFVEGPSPRIHAHKPLILQGLLASLLSFFQPQYAAAQKPVNTEQLDRMRELESIGAILPTVVDSTCDEEKIQPVFGRKIRPKRLILLNLGSRSLYWSNRFPFLHFRKIRTFMGRYAVRR